MSFAVRLQHRRRRRRAAAVAATSSPVTGPYVGLLTRTLAFAVDGAIVNGVALVTTAILTLTISVLSLPDSLEPVVAAIGGAVYVLWVAAYFATFWSTTGQTPGSRVLRIRVRALDGGRLPPRRALLRFLALTVAALPLFAGLLTILVDNRRRGLHDLVARTVVVEDERQAPASPGPRTGG